MELLSFYKCANLLICFSLCMHASTHINTHIEICVYIYMYVCIIFLLITLIYIERYLRWTWSSLLTFNNFSLLRQQKSTTSVSQCKVTIINHLWATVACSLPWESMELQMCADSPEPLRQSQMSQEQIKICVCFFSVISMGAAMDTCSEMPTTISITHLGRLSNN